MKDNRTPHKLPARSAENRNGRFSDFSSNKKLNKFTSKSLNAAFSSVSEDSADLSPISEISDANRNDDVTNFLLEKPSSVTSLPSDITPSKEITDMTSTNCFDANELGSYELPYVEVEFVVNFLKNVKPKVLNSVNAAAPQYRKLVDEIIEYVIQDFHTNTLPEERDHFAQILYAEKQMLFLCFFVLIIGVSVVIFFNSDMHRPYRGPMPT